MNASNLAASALAILETVTMYGAISTERLLQLWGGELGYANVRAIVEGLAIAGILHYTSAGLWIESK